MHAEIKMPGSKIEQAHPISGNFLEGGPDLLKASLNDFSVGGQVGIELQQLFQLCGDVFVFHSIREKTG